MCQSGDCLSDYNYDSATVRCPENQLCRPVTPDVWTCLKWPCTQKNFGQCVPLELLEGSTVKNREKCEEIKKHSTDVTKPAVRRVEDDLEFCSRFYVTLRQDLIPLVITEY